MGGQICPPPRPLRNSGSPGQLGLKRRRKANILPNPEASIRYLPVAPSSKLLVVVGPLFAELDTNKISVDILPVSSKDYKILKLNN